MNKIVSIILIALATPLLVGAVLLAVPVLRTADAVAATEIAQHVERARRLLHHYGNGEERLAEIIRQLRSQRGDSGTGGDDLEQILDRNRDTVEQVEENFNQQSRGRSAGTLRDLEERYRAAGGTGDVPAPGPSGLGGNISALVRSARNGLKARDAIIADNDRLLNDALTEVEAAIKVTGGDTSGTRHANANRVKGIILAAQAESLRRKAEWSRATGVQSRDALVESGVDMTRLLAEVELLQRSRITEQIDSLHADGERVEQELGLQTDEIKRIDATIQSLEAKISTLNAEADSARTAMDNLEEEGVNLLAPDGSETFARRFSELSKQHQQAEAESHGLQYGTLTDARIDDTGDYVRGSFVPIEPDKTVTWQRGLVGYRHDRETTNADIVGLETAIAETNENIAILEELAQRLAAKSSAARESIGESISRAAVVYSELELQLNEAYELFERGAHKAESAVRAFRAAAGAAGSQAQDARSRADALGPTSRDRSWHKLMSEDTWVAGQITNEAAQANLLLCSIRLEMTSAATDDLDAMTRVKAQLEIDAIDLTAYTARRDESRDAAIEAARAAIDDFERTSRGLGGSWTIAAQAAAAHYMLALLEDPGHVETAIQNYESAIEGADDVPAVQALTERLNALRSR